MLALTSILACSASTADVTSGGTGAAGGSGGDGASGGAGGLGGGGRAATTGDGGDGVGGFGGGAAGAGGGIASPCEEEAKDFIYLLGTDRTLSRFDPQAGTLAYLGKLMCPTEGLPLGYSMAVDRLGRAYVLYNNGQLFRVDTKTMGCESLPEYVKCQYDFCVFGMGFVSDSAGSDAETLHIAAFNNGFGKLDTETLAVTPVGYFSEMNGVLVELTGTAEGKLFGFFNWTPPTVAEVDAATGEVLSKMEPSLSIGTSLAFAHWGGRFFLFADEGIWRFDPATNETTTILQNVGFKISGAGVSTCAPTEVPE